MELSVVLAITAFLLVMMLRAYGGWSADYRVRAVSESLLNAIRLAQANAVAHNRFTAFMPTSGTPTYAATPSSNGTNWVAVQVPLAGSAEALSASSVVTANTLATGYKMSVAGTASGGATAAPICFNSLGQLASLGAVASGLSAACVAPADSTPVAYTVSSANAARSLRVLVYPSGQIRLCDALKTLSAINPDGCP